MERESSDIPFANYAVAFIDVLGQEKDLLKYQLVPDPDDNKKVADFNEVIKNTYGVIYKLRKAFNKFYYAYKSSHKDVEIPDDRIEVYYKMRETDIGIQYLADGLVFHSYLLDETVKVPMNNIWGMIAACGCLCLLQLASKHPIRGGIDIGWAGHLQKDELYGGGIARAHFLENEVAQYPRIVVSEDLLKYLKAMQMNPAQDMYAETNRRIAESCPALLTRDVDGYIIVDYLGQEFKEGIAGSIDISLIHKAYEYIMEQQSENHEKSTAEKRKLFARYSVLRNYFESRLPIWGIDLH